MSVKFRIHCVYSVSLPSVKTWMLEGTNDILHKNSYFFETTEPNRMEFSAKMQIISYCFKMLNNIFHINL